MNQLIGQQTNNFGELWEILKALTIVKQLKPQKIQDKPYYYIWKQSQEIIKETKTILWKMKSHTTPPETHNEKADKLANERREC